MIFPVRYALEAYWMMHRPDLFLHNVVISITKCVWWNHWIETGENRFIKPFKICESDKVNVIYRVRSACPLCNTFVRDSFYIFPSIDDEYFQPFLRSLLQSFQYLQNFTEGEAIVGNQEIRPILANMRLNEQFNNQFGREIDSLINRIQSIHSNCAVLKDNLRYYNEILSETMGLILKQNRKLIAMKTKQRKGKKINKKDRLCVRKGTRLRNSWLITNREE